MLISLIYFSCWYLDALGVPISFVVCFVCLRILLRLLIAWHFGCLFWFFCVYVGMLTHLGCVCVACRLCGFGLSAV